MANNYVKIWTTILHDEKFLSLTGNQRGAYFQLIMECKCQSDSGHVYFRSYAQVGHSFGTEGSTIRRVLGVLRAKSLIEMERDKYGMIHIHLPKYLYWQRVKPQEVIDDKRQNPSKSGELKAKSPPSRADQSRPEQTRADHTIPYREVIEHLNLLSGKSYRHTSGNTQRYIRIRWNEGFRLDDFLYVNQIKAEEWLGTEREKYLRPETLYGTKFEGYRQERRMPRQYSEKTNKALVAAALFLKNKGVSLENSRLTEISSNDA